MYYYLIVALQAYCIYHLYKNRNNYFWFFIILFIPVIGSIIYLITQVYNKRDAETIQNEITTIINPSKKVKDLSAKVDFSDTYQNRTNLADAYFEIEDYNNALINYEKALKDTSGNDFYSIEKIIECYFELGAYDKIPNYAIKIKGHRDFKKSRVQFLYGMSLYKEDQFEEAEKELLEINIKYSNYEERLSLSKFLTERGKSSAAKDILMEISSEAKHMIKSNRKKYKSTINEVESLLKQYEA